MKRFELLSLCKKATVVNLNRGINTGVVLLAKGRRVRRSYGRQKIVQMDSDHKVLEDTEYMGDTYIIDHEEDTMRVPKPYKLQPKHIRDKIDLKIARKKFFEPPPEPLTLTYNERECIRYLHKSDKEQWSVQALSEVFPATPRVIQKVIRSRRIITPTGARELDRVVEKNWDLLAEGKLEAEPHVLEHLKKFINHRKEFLEKINENFHVPDVKIHRPMWNRGQFSGILSSYEKAVEKLIEDSTKMLQDGTTEVKDEAVEKSSLDAVHEKISDVVDTHDLRDKDSFLFQNLKNFYSKPTTLEDLEKQIVKQANLKKKLDVFEEAILEDKLKGRHPNKNDGSEDFKELKTYLKSFVEPESVKEEAEKFQDIDINKIPLQQRLKIYSRKMEISENEVLNKKLTLPDSRTKFATEAGVGELLNNKQQKTEEPKSETQNAEKTEEKPKIDFSDPERVRDDGSEDFKELKSYPKSFVEPESVKEEAEKFQDIDINKIPLRQRLKIYSRKMEIRENEVLNKKLTLPDSRTKFATEAGIGELLNNKQQKTEEPKSETQNTEKKEEKPKIDFSDPERVRRENVYYDAQVKDIEDTSFWGRLQTSVEKAAVETDKKPVYVPVEGNSGSSFREVKIFSGDQYPERITIPKNKRGSGLTFKVKDCYYDDDGEFLYRVPGMIK